MISFKQYITELFDKPYPYKQREDNLRPTDYGGSMGKQTFEAKTKDGDTLGLRFGHFSSKPSNAFPDGNYEITVEFWVRPSGGGRATMGITGRGDAGRIMSTVLEVTKKVIEEHDPTRLTFHADKFVNPAAKEKVESGRIGLYNAMVKRFAKKNGFSAKLPNPKTVEKRGEATYHLNKIGLRVWDKTITEESEYQGKKVTLNKPFRTPDESKKFAVYAKNDKGKVVIVRFGDPNMEIKRDDPKRLKAYRSRMGCDDNPGPKWKANYWSCYQWRAGAKVDD